MNQDAGLNPRAQVLVGQQGLPMYMEETIRIYPDGRREQQPPKQICLQVHEERMEAYEFDGLGDDREYCESLSTHLANYTFSTGPVYLKRVQEVHVKPLGWFRGSDYTYFLALQQEDRQWVPESLWTKDEMEAWVKESDRFRNTF